MSVRKSTLVSGLTLGLLAASLAPSMGAGAKTTVTVWYQWNLPFIKKICDNFNQSHTSVQIKPMTLFDGNDPSKFLAAISAGTPPNIVLGYSDSIYEWSSKNLLLPLDNFIRTRKINLNNYVASSVEFCKYKGKSYGMPLDWDPDHVLWINNTAFAQAGLDSNHPPKTTVEFEQTAAKLTMKNSDGRYSRIGWVPWEGWIYWYMYWPAAFGASMYDRSRDMVTLNGPKVVEAYDWLGQWWKKYDFGKLGNIGFMNEKAAMMVGGDWNGLTLNQQKKKINYSIHTAPYPPGEKPFIPCSGWAYMVPKSAKNLKETYEVLEFLTDSWASTEFCKGISWLPANIKARQDSAFTQDNLYSQLLRVTAGNYDKEWLASNPICKTIWEVMNEAIGQVTSQKKSSKDALNVAQQKAEIDLKKAMSRVRAK